MLPSAYQLENFRKLSSSEVLKHMSERPGELSLLGSGIERMNGYDDASRRFTTTNDLGSMAGAESDRSREVVSGQALENTRLSGGLVSNDYKLREEAPGQIKAKSFDRGLILVEEGPAWKFPAL